jgi:hypothetical protein
MKISFKNVSKVLGVALLAGAVGFSACKKDDEDSAGTKAGNGMCDCMNQSTDEKKLTCIAGVMAKYIDQIEDETFQKDMAAASAKCADELAGLDLGGLGGE